MRASAAGPLVLYVAPPSSDTGAAVDALRSTGDLIVETADSTQDAFSRLSNRSVDCIVSAYEFPETDGIAFLEGVRAEFGTVPFVLHPAAGSESLAVRAFRHGVTDYVANSQSSEETIGDRVTAVIDGSTESRRASLDAGVSNAASTRLDLALDATNTGIWEWDLETDELRWDRQAEQLAGFEPGEFAGRYEAFADRVHPADVDTIETARERALETGSYEAEFRIVDGDTERWLHTRAELFDDATGLGRLVGVGWDITERIARQQDLEATKAELEELAARLELTLEETDSGVWQTDLQNNVAVWDDACYRLFGYEPDDSREVLELFAARVLDDDLQRVKANMEHAIETDSDYQSDFRIELPGGEQRWIRSRGVVEYDDEGTPARMLGIETDITDQKRAEQAVEATKERYQRIFQLSEDYLVAIEASGAITDVTPGIERVVGYSREEFIGTDAFSYLHPEDTDRLRERFGTVVENPEREIDIEYRIRTKDGDYRWMEARGNNHLDDSLLDGIVLNVRDITHRKQREQKLADTTARLQQKNDQLERLAQIVSHDLKTPLSTAEKLVGLLRADLGEPSAEVEQSLADLEVTHDRLQEFAARLPRLARESTDVEGTTDCELRAVAQAAWQVVETGPLDLQIESSRPLTADPERLQRVFENLFQNTVTHAVEAVDADANGHAPATEVCVGTVEEGFYIADDGLGIAPDQREGVFEYGMSTGDGTGFGLAIVRTIVEAHGWTVGVGDSTSGGARFEVDTETDYASQ